MTGPLTLRVPRENFAVPLQLVAVQFDEAIRLRRAHRGGRYVAGVYEAFRWLTAMTNTQPVSRGTRLANRDAILAELVVVGSVASGIPCPGAPIGEIHLEWARGVEATLRWASGRSASGTPPLPWPGGRPPTSQTPTRAPVTR